MTRHVLPVALLAAAAATALAAPAAHAGGVLLQNADFSAGNTGFTSAYTFSGTTDPGPGTYTVGTNPQLFNPGADPYGDHTTGSSLMLIVDGSQDAGVPLWSQTVAVSPGTSYDFSFYVSSWGKNGDEPGAYDPASLEVLLDGVAVGSPVLAPDQTGVWDFHSFTLVPTGASATITLVDLNTDYIGNDFALDDFSLAAVPEASTTASFGLLLALGLGGVIVAAKRKRSGSVA